MQLRMRVTLVHMPQQSGGVHGCSVGSTVVQVASGNLAANLAFYSPHAPQSRGRGWGGRGAVETEGNVTGGHSFQFTMKFNPI